MGDVHTDNRCGLNKVYSKCRTCVYALFVSRYPDQKPLGCIERSRKLEF